MPLGEDQLDQATTRTPTSVGHLQLVIDDGRWSDATGTIVSGDGQDVSARGKVGVVDQAGLPMGTKRSTDIRQHLTPASKQKILDVLEELRQVVGGIVLP